ncbi:hypothetical protein AALO_G00270010 [Alosa alosa]|uniref:Uncharacterized protein n=1 Tax=Alosa alosa TaxID=278164 RepID=A0AAV6FQD8_9TELE|nr:hypothetical protein AALO_G00270010 [Alosa alosa]
MAKFNLKGKGKKGKHPLEGTKVYRAIQEGLMKFDPTATEENIKANVSEHLKHAPQPWRIYNALISQPPHSETALNDIGLHLTSVVDSLPPYALSFQSRFLLIVSQSLLPFASMDEYNLPDVFNPLTHGIFFGKESPIKTCCWYACTI